MLIFLSKYLFITVVDTLIAFNTLLWIKYDFNLQISESLYTDLYNFSFSRKNVILVEYIGSFTRD